MFRYSLAVFWWLYFNSFLSQFGCMYFDTIMLYFDTSGYNSKLWKVLCGSFAVFASLNTSHFYRYASVHVSQTVKGRLYYLLSQRFLRRFGHLLGSKTTYTPTYFLSTKGVSLSTLYEFIRLKTFCLQAPQIIPKIESRSAA